MNVYPFIEAEHPGHHSVKRACELLEVSRAGFYHRVRGPVPDDRQDMAGDGSGGSKISWRPFGTLWSRNITPDLTTGIGQWSDAEIERAIRSGVSRNGRALHWQGMIWDHASNWDEDDLRSIVAYLHTLPPVVKKIPDPTPPSADDCAVYTFWLTASITPGCGT